MRTAIQMPAPVPLTMPKRRASEIAFDRAEKLTRGEAAAITGVSKTTLRRAEGSILPVVRDDAGVHYYDRAAVEAAARAGLLGRCRTRDQTAVAWGWFERGASIVDVVRVLRCTADEADTLHARWLDARGSGVTLPRHARDRLAEVGIEVDSLDQLVDVAIAAVQRRA